MENLNYKEEYDKRKGFEIMREKKDRIEAIEKKLNNVLEKLKDVSTKEDIEERLKEVATKEDVEKIRKKNKLITVFEFLIAAGAVAGFVAFVASYSTKMERFDNRISANEKSIESINSTIVNIDDTLESINERLTKLETSMDNVNSYLGNAITATLVSNNLPTMYAPEDMEQPVVKDNNVIASDIQTGKTYTTEELENKTLLIPYIVDGKEYVFLGQFNSRIHWDGNCVINGFDNNELVIVMDALYSDGELISYKQIIKDEEKNIWRINERKRVDGVNVGETWCYEYKDIYTKYYELEEVRYFDVATYKTLRTKIDTELVTYYDGNTKNGTYNDDGKSLYVSYEDGKVKTMYYGGMKNGDFEDESGEAIQIAKKEDGEYLYYEGKFENGDKIDDEKHYENPVSLNRINEIIENNNLNYSFDWYDKK